MGIPVEIITMLGSTLLGGVMKLWGMKASNDANKDELALKALQTQITEVDKARDSLIPDIQWTRRVLALSGMFAIVVLPKLVAAFIPATLVTFGWTEFHPGFLFIEGHESFVWKTVSGFAITPLDTHFISAMIGLYFGGSLVGHNK